MLQSKESNERYSHKENEENLTGNLPKEEACFLYSVLLEAGSDISLWHPDDMKNFDPENPLAGLCDAATALLALIYADPTVGDHVEWIRVQKSGSTGWKPRDYDVHYDLVTRKYGRLDLTREQFPKGREFRLVRAKKIDHQNRVRFTNANMTDRLSGIINILTTRAAGLIDTNPNAISTPELLNFLAQSCYPMLQNKNELKRRYISR